MSGPAPVNGVSSIAASMFPWIERRVTAERVFRLMREHDLKTATFASRSIGPLTRKKLYRDLRDLREVLLEGKMEVLRMQKEDGPTTEHSDPETLRLEESIANYAIPGESTIESAVHRELSDEHRHKEIAHVRNGKTLSRKPTMSVPDVLEPDSPMPWLPEVATSSGGPVPRVPTPYPSTPAVSEGLSDVWGGTDVYDPSQPYRVLGGKVAAEEGRYSYSRTLSPATPERMYSPTQELVSEAPSPGDVPLLAPLPVRPMPTPTEERFDPAQLAMPPTPLLQHQLPVPYLRILARDPSLPFEPALSTSEELETFYIESKNGHGFLLAYREEEFNVVKRVKAPKGDEGEKKL